jgi:hypothetical protein
MITKEVTVLLTELEIVSPETITIKLNVHSEADPDNEDGVTYTITYPKENGKKV